MRIFLVRHGATDWNLAGRCQGTTDLELNETGLRQAEAAALGLTGEKITAVYSSDLKRARQTAEAVARRHHLAVLVEESIRELDHGELEGLTFAEIHAVRPDFIRRWRDEPADADIPGGEKLAQVARRAWDGLGRIVFPSLRCSAGSPAPSSTDTEPTTCRRVAPSAWITVPTARGGCLPV